MGRGGDEGHSHSSCQSLLQIWSNTEIALTKKKKKTGTAEYTLPN